MGLFSGGALWRCWHDWSGVSASKSALSKGAGPGTDPVGGSKIPVTRWAPDRVNK